MAPKKEKEGWFDFLTWRFVATNISGGMLQAIGAIVIYAWVIYIVISGYIGNSEFKNAIVLKTGGLINPKSPGRSSSTSSATSSSQDS